jgi:hypothetical protein
MDKIDFNIFEQGFNIVVTDNRIHVDHTGYHHALQFLRDYVPGFQLKITSEGFMKSLLRSMLNSANVPIDEQTMKNTRILNASFLTLKEALERKFGVTTNQNNVYILMPVEISGKGWSSFEFYYDSNSNRFVAIKLENNRVKYL